MASRGLPLPARGAKLNTAPRSPTGPDVVSIGAGDTRTEMRLAPLRCFPPHVTQRSAAAAVFHCAAATSARPARAATHVAAARAMASAAAPAAAAAHAHPRPRFSRVQAIVFDMDGTLTARGAIDFKRMRERARVPPGEDLITYIEAVEDPADRAARWAALEHEEELGLARMRLMPHAGALFRHLHARGIARRGLLTRNNAGAMVRTVGLLREAVALEAAMAAGSGGGGGSGGAAQSPAAQSPAHPTANELFGIMLSRDFTPAKPHPHPLLHICAHFGAPPHEVVMVGDSIDDIACARAAGCIGVLIGDDPACPTYREALPHADYAVSTLQELTELLDDLHAKGHPHER